jgi:chromosome segregation protein
MYLKRLDIQGFKTFAGRNVLEFRPGITAVVGPNGSGKSNLSDAVRWVLGEQSMATLRCKRPEELIYAGGGRRAPAGFAEVALTIDNSDRLLPIEFDEVTIARRLTRAGDNEYYLNRARVRLRDVLEAVEPLGGSYTIINQGLVDAALTLRPEERRKLFEDAAEIGGFELRKAEALRRLRETDTNLQRLGDLLSELEPRLRALKRQAGQARQHKDLSAELHALQVRSYAMQWRAARALSGRTRADVVALEGELERARAAQQAIGAELSALRAALRGRREALGELHQQSAGLHRQAEAAQRELAVGAERLAALTRRGEDLERQRNELAARREQAQEQRAAAGDELARAEAGLEATRAELRQAEAELAGMEAQRRALALELRGAQDASVRAAGAVAEQQSRLEQLHAQRARLQREAGELAAAQAQAEQRLEGARAQVAAAAVELGAAEEARSKAQAAEVAARSEIDELRQGRAQAEEQRNAARRALADAEARLDSLSRLARSYAGAFAGVRAAMQWAERAGRAGFALVQSIIRTPAELETAVEVALGSRLQNIVVERWEDAEETIAELKRSGAGRATFMPLDTIRAGGAEARVQADGQAVLGIAADLVDYDEHYAPIARQLLGRVLIVKNLPTARAELRRLSGGWTIVTLGGEQVSTGGAVTGGAATKESGALRRERELRELPAQVAAARAALEAAEARRAELEAQAQRLAQSLRELEAQAREAGRQIEARRAAVDAAGRRVAQAEQERGWAEQRRERLGRDLAGLDAQEAELRARQDEAAQAATRAESRLAELRARQDEAAQHDRVAQERLAGLRAAAGAAEGQLRAQRSLLAAHEATLAQVERQSAESGRAVAGLAEERERIGVDHDRAAATHAALLAEIDALRAQIDPAEAALGADEVRLAALEGDEERATASLLEREAAHGRAALEAQRAADRQEALFERAVADGVELPERDEDGQAEDGEPASELQPAIEQLRGKILRLGAVNPLALEEYEETAERQRFLGEQSDDLQRASTTLHELIAELDGAMSDRFQRTFEAVAREFEQSFPALFGGGSAKLVLAGGAERNGHHPQDDGLNGAAPPAGAAEPARPQPQGVEIVARPPGKKQQNISLLSGGERTLTAAALLFAILKVNPSPFCILDETDAALDESNVGRFREALQRLTGQTQFILITHNRGTIEAADTLYGVTMGDDGASKMISLRVEEYVGGEG